jgi:hypothetical protein
MPEDQVHPTISNSELQDVSNIIRVAADRLAIENAFQLIDSYVQEMRQQRSSTFNPAELRWPLLDGREKTQTSNHWNSVVDADSTSAVNR